MGNLRGKSILLVEDIFVVAASIRQHLQSIGCIVVGPAADVETALELARSHPLDGALLDVKLNGADVYPVAVMLRDRGIPFVLVTAYPRPEAEFKSTPWVSKPFTLEQLTEALEISLAISGASSAPSKAAS
jgi:CheY-like chemotaxis protein